MPSRQAARRLLALLLALLFLPVLPALHASAAGAPALQPLAGTPVDLKLWIHADDTLSMVGNTNEFVAPQVSMSRVWTTADGLHKDLCVDGVDIGGGRQGFSVDLLVGFNTILAGVEIQVRVIDQSDTPVTLGQENFTFIQGGAVSNSLWNVNFTTSRTACWIARGHKIALEFSSAARLTYGDFNDAHLAFRATDPVLPTAETANALGPTSLFYPNDLDGSRQLIVRGTLDSAFTDALIARVLVVVRDPSNNAVENATATLNLGNYSHTWNYPRSPAGTYTVAVEVQDAQGHSYNVSTSFSFAAYGLRITTPGQSGGSATQYTTQAVAAQFELTVTNVGGSPTPVSLSIENTPSPGWTANFTPPSFSLEPGAWNLSLFRVLPAPAIGPGNSTVINVIAQANADPAPLKARASLLTTTIIQREILLVIAPTSSATTVKPGGFASYNFTITNNGGLSTDVSVQATAAPEGWIRDLQGEGVSVNGTGWDLQDLAPDETRTLALGVSAPSNTSGATTFACTVTARSFENASAVATFSATTHMLVGIELKKLSPVDKPALNPGEHVDFDVEVINNDPLRPHSVAAGDINVTELPPPHPPGNPQLIDGVDGGSISFNAPINCCDEAPSSGILRVTIGIPSRALTGTYRFNVTVNVDHDPSTVAQIFLELEVNTIRAASIRIDNDPARIVLREGAATAEATIANEGNLLIQLDLAASFERAGVEDLEWTAEFRDDNDVAITRVSVPAYGSVRVKVALAAPVTAFNGDARVLHIELTRAFGGVDRFTLNPPVEVVVELSAATRATRLWQQYFPWLFGFGMLGAFSAYLALLAWRGPKAKKVPPAKPAAAATVAPEATASRRPVK